MRNRVIRALMLVELRRVRPIAVRTVLLGAAGLVVLFLLDHLSRGWAAALLGWVSFSGLFALVSHPLRDKLDGSMEFLRSLPADPGEIAASRLLAVAVVAVPTGVLGGLGAWLAVVPFLPGIPAWRLLAPCMGGAVALEGLIAGVAVALALRMEPRHFANLVPVGFLVVWGGGEGIARLGLSWSTVERAVTAPWVPMAAPAAVLAVCALTGAAAFRLARSGIAHFRPPKDRLTW